MDKTVSLEFISTSVPLHWHGHIFRDAQFMHPSELEVNDLKSFFAIKAVNNQKENSK